MLRLRNLQGDGSSSRLSMTRYACSFMNLVLQNSHQLLYNWWVRRNPKSSRIRWGRDQSLKCARTWRINSRYLRRIAQSTIICHLCSLFWRTTKYLRGNFWVLLQRLLLSSSSIRLNECILIFVVKEVQQEIMAARVKTTISRNDSQHQKSIKFPLIIKSESRVLVVPELNTMNSS